jgi:hypothetical protein
MPAIRWGRKREGKMTQENLKMDKGRETLSKEEKMKTLRLKIFVNAVILGLMLLGWGVNAVFAAPPVAPSNLIATAVSNSQINLTWKDNSDETGFKIERKQWISGNWVQIATVNANVTTYSNMGLPPKTRYYYRVRASGTGGDSAYSNEDATSTSSLLSEVYVKPTGNDTFDGRSWPTAVKTIEQAVYYLAADNATIYLEAGTYVITSTDYDYSIPLNRNITFIGKGMEGSTMTTLQAEGAEYGDAAFSINGARVEFKDLYFKDFISVFKLNGGGSLIIKKCRFIGLNPGGAADFVFGASNYNRIEITNSIFYGFANYFSSATAVGPNPTFSIINNTFLGGMYLLRPVASNLNLNIRNNIFDGRSEWPIIDPLSPYQPGYYFNYNCIVYDTSSDPPYPTTWFPTAEGNRNRAINNTGPNPLSYVRWDWTTPASADLHLQSGSPCKHAGDPGILNLDGTRSDMGAYGGGIPRLAHTIYVPGGYSRIQDALAAAQPGDTIKVAAGTYPEGGIDGTDYMNIKKDGIKLSGYDPADPTNPNPANKPIIDATGKDYGLGIAPALGDPDNTVRNIVIENLMIRNYGKSDIGGGCGLSVQNANSVIIRNNVIKSDPTALNPDKSQFAMYLLDSKNVEISNNELRNAGEYNIYIRTPPQSVDPNPNINIHDNKFYNNWGYSIYSRGPGEHIASPGYEFFPLATDGAHYNYEKSEQTKYNIFYRGEGSRANKNYATLYCYGVKYFAQYYAPDSYKGTAPAIAGSPSYLIFNPPRANAPTTAPETIYANGTNIVNWKIYDDRDYPSINVTYDNKTDSNVTTFGGTYNSGYILGQVPWSNTQHKVIEWRQRCANDYKVYVSVRTNQGYKYITYQPWGNVSLANGTYAPVILGNATKSSWVTVTRDLQEDLRKTYPNATIQSVNAFLIRGAGRIASVKLMDQLPQATVYSDGTNNNTFSCWYGEARAFNESGNYILNITKTNSTQPALYCILGDEVGNDKNAKDVPWANTIHKNIGWRVKFPSSSWYTVAALVETNATVGRYKEIVYLSSNYPYRGFNSTENKTIHYLNSTLVPVDGNWHNVTRNLTFDLKDFNDNGRLTDSQDKTTAIISVNGIVISTNSTGKIDDIKLLK